MRLVAASGYFDPLHRGHVEYLEAARRLGDELVVILNNDHQAAHLRGVVRTPQTDRARIVGSLRCVDRVVVAHDHDNDVAETLATLRPKVFAKGFSASASEVATCSRLGIEVRIDIGDDLHLHDLLYNAR